MVVWLLNARSHSIPLFSIGLGYHRYLGFGLEWKAFGSESGTFKYQGVQVQYKYKIFLPGTSVGG